MLTWLGSLSACLPCLRPTPPSLSTPGPLPASGSRPLHAMPCLLPLSTSSWSIAVQLVKSRLPNRAHPCLSWAHRQPGCRLPLPVGRPIQEDPGPDWRVWANGRLHDFSRRRGADAGGLAVKIDEGGLGTCSPAASAAAAPPDHRAAKGGPICCFASSFPDAKPLFYF